MVFSRRATQSIATCGSVTVRYPPTGAFAWFTCQGRAGRVRDRRAPGGVTEAVMFDILQRFPGAPIAPQLDVDNTADWIRLSVLTDSACSVDLRVNWLAPRDSLPARSGFVVRGLYTHFHARDGTSGVGARGFTLNPGPWKARSLGAKHGGRFAGQNAQNRLNYGVIGCRTRGHSDAEYSAVQTQTRCFIPESKPCTKPIIRQSKPWLIGIIPQSKPEVWPMGGPRSGPWLRP